MNASDGVPDQWTVSFEAALELEYGGRPQVGMLATVDREGHPHGRCVVLRHVEPNGHLWFATDSRSAKSAQIRVTAWAEVVFWLATARVQYRLGGPTRIVTASDEDPRRSELWCTLSNRSRALFFGPPPGRPRNPQAAFPVEVGAEHEPPDPFELLVLDPARVDFLDIKPFPHQRRCWLPDGEWRVHEINP